ncbi:uncharacterized protein J4E88_009252 [Alternaria novae-zelandiae]|uniref:uncharacterized protein n=1 Tax=Alternaria novae-zelandiae TaxID=430562 RepID=UPI0020C58236|nr:uncharacterized protein J4E88_009252 [Alternaria novae-zelandiae]KAI4671219.1 hypothetical protein J4E88_009252 [Alternaria novae-zelandiae]
MASFLDAESAQKYKNAEKATRPYVKTIVQQSGIAAYLETGAEANILDFACGTGVVAQEIYDTVPKEKWEQLKVLGTDISPPMLEYLRARGETQGWTGLDTKIVDGNPYSPSREELRENFCGLWADESYLAQQLEAVGLGRVGTSNEKKAVSVGTPDVFVATMQFPLQYVRSTWWQGEREGILEDLNGAMKGIVQQEVGEDGEVELVFDGIVGWGWKSG